MSVAPQVLGGRECFWRPSAWVRLRKVFPRVDRPPKPIRIDMAREDLQELVQSAEPELFEIEVDSEKFAGEFLFVEVLNLSFTGPALPLAFSASPDDGLFDVVFLNARVASECSRGLASIRRMVRHP